jgi:hypothetical protein
MDRNVANDDLVFQICRRSLCDIIRAGERQVRTKYQ